MVNYVPNRLYAIDIYGTLLGPGGRINHHVHKVFGLDTPKSREFFEVLGRLVVPHPEVLYSDMNFSCVEHAMGSSDIRMRERFKTINDIIKDSGEEELTGGVRKEVEHLAIHYDTHGHLDEVVVSIVPPSIAEQLIPDLQELLRTYERLRDSLGHVRFLNESTIEWRPKI